MYRRFGPFILLGLLVMAVAGGTVLALSRGEPPAAPTASPGSSVPSIVNVQGRLTDSQRNPIDGSVQVTFRIYTGDTAGTPIWYETQSVTAQNGLCNVLSWAAMYLSLQKSLVQVQRDGWLSSWGMIPKWHPGCALAVCPMPSWLTSVMI